MGTASTRPKNYHESEEGPRMANQRDPNCSTDAIIDDFWMQDFQSESDAEADKAAHQRYFLQVDLSRKKL